MKNHTDKYIAENIFMFLAYVRRQNQAFLQKATELISRGNKEVLKRSVLQ